MTTWFVPEFWLKQAYRVKVMGTFAPGELRLVVMNCVLAPKEAPEDSAERSCIWLTSTLLLN
jgi:hypothetical protein